ncbi:hypothetical protein AGMMS49982_22710 [Bacteroidia bacterium]|nr:hypothetical protein AGMMS49982_22710 [Bacteroidia bacterium]
MTKKKFSIKSMALVLLGATFFSCGETDDKVAVTKVNITGTGVSSGKVILGAGDSLQLSAAVLPAGADQTVTWASAKATAASVDANGLVRAIAVGDSATISATSATAGDMKDEVVVYVVNNLTTGLAGTYIGNGSINANPVFPDAEVTIVRADAITLFWSMTLDVTAVVSSFVGEELPEGTSILIMENIPLTVTSENGILQVNGTGQAKQALMPDGTLTPDLAIDGTIEDGRLAVVITVGGFASPVGYSGRIPQ